MGSEAASAVEFHLTGFKKFHNVADNPTETLVTRAMQYMANNPLPYGTEIKTCLVLETAGAGALDDLLGKFDEALLGKKNPAQNGGLLDVDKEVEAMRQESPVVWIHLGVNSGATRFAVEQRAVNEATFRCPDEMGWQPDHLPIVAEDGDITAVRETKFAVGKIVCTLVNEGFDVVVSDDAGRFVCNYVYYQSLRHADNHGTKSLFVHVPPFSVISEEKQMEFLFALLRVVASYSGC